MMQQHAVKRVAPEALRARVVHGLCGAAVLLVCGAAGYFSQALFDSAAFPINRVSVEGDFRYLSAGHVEALVANSVTRGFFGVDVGEIKERILEESWLEDAAVLRVWPDALHVVITERRPAAWWGKDALLNAEADVFLPGDAEVPPELPRLSGPVGSEAEVLRRFEIAQRLLDATGLRLARLDLSARRAWSCHTRDGVAIVIGRRDFERRLARFARAYETMLAQDWPEITRVDLRYTNGLAVTPRAPAGTSNIEPDAIASRWMP